MPQLSVVHFTDPVGAAKFKCTKKPRAGLCPPVRATSAVTLHRAIAALAAAIITHTSPLTQTMAFRPRNARLPVRCRTGGNVGYQRASTLGLLQSNVFGALRSPATSLSANEKKHRHAKADKLESILNVPRLVSFKTCRPSKERRLPPL